MAFSYINMFASMTGTLFLLLPFIGLYLDQWILVMIFGPMFLVSGALIFSAFLTQSRDSFELYTMVLTVFSYVMVLTGFVTIFVDYLIEAEMVLYYLWVVFVLLIGSTVEYLLIRLFLYGSYRSRYGYRGRSNSNY